MKTIELTSIDKGRTLVKFDNEQYLICYDSVEVATDKIKEFLRNEISKNIDKITGI